MNLSFEFCLFSKLRKGESSVMGWCLQFTLSKFSYCSLFFPDIFYSNHHLQWYFKSISVEHLYSRTRITAFVNEFRSNSNLSKLNMMQDVLNFFVWNIADRYINVKLKLIKKFIHNMYFPLTGRCSNIVSILSAAVNFSSISNVSIADKKLFFL